MLQRTTKLHTGMTKFRIFREIFVLHDIFWWPNMRLKVPWWPHFACLHSKSTYGLYSCCDVLGSHCVQTRRSLDQMDCKLNENLYICDVLHPVVATCLRCLSKAIFYRDYPIPRVSCRVLTIFNTHEVQFLAWPGRLLDLSAIENIWLLRD